MALCSLTLSMSCTSKSTINIRNGVEGPTFGWESMCNVCYCLWWTVPEFTHNSLPLWNFDHKFIFVTMIYLISNVFSPFTYWTKQDTTFKWNQLVHQILGDWTLVITHKQHLLVRWCGQLGEFLAFVWTKQGMVNLAKENYSLLVLRVTQTFVHLHVLSSNATRILMLQCRL